MKRLLLGVAATAALVFASAAVGANTAKIVVSHSPMVLAGSKSTTIHVSIPQTTDPIYMLRIYAPTGYQANLAQAAGTTIGNVDAAAFSYDTQLTLPLSGTVVTDDPAKYATQMAQCQLPSAQAVWVLNLSVSGQTLQVPLFVNPTTGAAAALGSYELRICLPPPDVPAGTPGRAAFGAQLLDAKFTVNGIFTTPTAGGLLRWESFFMPFTPHQGAPNPAGTFEARALVPLPIVLGLHAKVVKKSGVARLGGSLAEGGLPDAGFTVTVYRGASSSRLLKAGSAKANAKGAWTATAKVKPLKSVYFQVRASAGERDYTAQGCQGAITSQAPAGCVSATLSSWSAVSVLLHVKR